MAIPDEQHYIEMDNTIGTDYLCVIYSLRPIDIEQVHRDIERTSGNFEARVRTVMADKLVKKQNIKFQNSSIAFKAKSKGKTAVAMIIETKHVK